MNILENIFSITNKEGKNNKIYKVITILGIKFKILNKYKTLLRVLDFENKKLKNELKQLIKNQNSTLKNFSKKYENDKKYIQYQIHRYCPDNKRELALKDWYFQKTGESLDLETPKTYNEKIQWLKLYDSTPLKTRLADKYLVRDWVKEKIGEEHLIPLLGVWDKFDDIDFDKLPCQFVLKCNHGSGYNIIVKDKSKLDLEDTKNKINTWLNEDFAFRGGLEMHYSSIPRKVIAEEYIDPKISDIEIQVWCFNGEIEFISYENTKTTDKPSRCILSKDWKLLDFSISPKNYNTFNCKPKKIDKLDDLIKISEVLSKDFKHVRVDYIIVNNNIKFREMTFTSGSGLSKFEPKSTTLKYGNLINIKNI